MLPKSAKGAQGVPNGPATLRYPKQLLDSKADYVKFTFYEYVAPFSSQVGGATFGLDAYNNSVNSGLNSTGKSIIMYMPEDIGADYGGSWSETNLSNMAKGALGTFGGVAGGDIGASVGAIVKSLTEMGTNAIVNGTLTANAISDALSKANFASLTVNDVFAAATGQILNPNTEVLYKGPKMRNFSLSFKMAPRNAPEATEIKQIIHAFKYATLPQFGKSNGDEKNASFVTVPQIVDVSFMAGSAANPWVSQFKPSAITSFDISQTPDGAWSTYGDGSPVATTMKITFQELKMLYADELSESGETF